MLSSSSSPTQGDLRIIFCELIQHLNKHTNSDYSQSTVANAIKIKLESYWPNLNYSSMVSGLLDLRNKLVTYDFNERVQAINMLRHIYGKYKPIQENEAQVISPVIKTSREF